MKTLENDAHSIKFKHLQGVQDEQLPVPKHKLHNWTHFATLYAAEHVAATEFVIGATFVALGAKTMDIVLGLLIGNILAVLSWTLITAPIAVDTRLSLYAYLKKIAGKDLSRIYDWVNVLIFTVISAAMVTVSATAIRFAVKIPAQLNWYPTNAWFVLIVILLGLFVVFVTIYGFKAVSEFSSICAPWLFVMFISGAFVLFPVLSNDVLGQTRPESWADFLAIGNSSIWTGTTSTGEPGIGLVEVIGFAWAANTITHFGLIDMALLRFAKKSSYGLATSTGMLFGHYIAWIAAGIMGAGAAIVLGKGITALDPGDVAFHALGWSGFIIVLVAGWTTAITNLYRAGLAAQSIYSNVSRKKTTLIVGLVMVVIACFPFVFSQILPLLTYAGLLVAPIGAIVFSEHQLFPRIGLTPYWSKYQGYRKGWPASLAWFIGLIFGFGLNYMDVMSFYYLFLPTWFFTILIYSLLAYFGGASNPYDEERAKEKEELELIEEYLQESKVEKLSPPNKSKLLRTASFIWLVFILILAANVFWGSDTMASYEINRDLFYRYGFTSTLVYFLFACWALRIKKSKQL